MEKSGNWFGKNFISNSSGLTKHKERELLTIKNERALFEEHTSSCKGRCRCNPMRSFSADQILEATESFRHDNKIKEATNYFQSNYNDEFCLRWYKGTLEERLVLIKRYEFTYNNEAYRDIVVSSQMSRHRNVLKLLGYCLEFTDPVLVYEDAENGPLDKIGHVASDGTSLPWRTRLSVAKDIASAITYLHTAFPRPIIHRDIKPLNIFMDKNKCLSKLCNFTLSITIPEGKTHVDDIVHGTFGFMDPVYVNTSKITEHTDVYSFGIFLLVLLTGKSAIDVNRSETEVHICNYVANMIKEERFDEIVDGEIVEELRDIVNVGDVKEELKAMIKLGLRCVEDRAEDRPLMIEVARQLAVIERSTRLN